MNSYFCSEACHSSDCQIIPITFYHLHRNHLLRKSNHYLGKIVRYKISKCLIFDIFLPPWQDTSFLFILLMTQEYWPCIATSPVSEHPVLEWGTAGHIKERKLKGKVSWKEPQEVFQRLPDRHDWTQSGFSLCVCCGRFSLGGKAGQVSNSPKPPAH